MANIEHQVSNPDSRAWRYATQYGSTLNVCEYDYIIVGGCSFMLIIIRRDSGLYTSQSALSQPQYHYASPRSRLL